MLLLGSAAAMRERMEDIFAVRVERRAGSTRRAGMLSFVSSEGPFWERLDGFEALLVEDGVDVSLGEVMFGRRAYASPDSWIWAGGDRVCDIATGPEKRSGEVIEVYGLA